MESTKRIARAAAVLAMVVGAAACASTNSGGEASDGGGSGPDASNVLTHEQLVASNQRNVYQAIQNLRPRWLRARGNSSLTSETTVSLFVDGAPNGDVLNLRSFPIQGVAQVEYLNAREAAFRYGTAAGTGGAILLTRGGG